MKDTMAARVFMKLFFMHHLHWIEAHRDARRVVRSEDGGAPNQRERAGQKSEWPVQANGPTERLLVDDEDQDQRQKKPQHQAGNTSECSEKSCFRKDDLAQLRAGGAQIAE